MLTQGKVVFIGTTNVGKTTLFKRIETSTFQQYETTTTPTTITLQTKNGKKYYMWDTAGQEKYQALAPLYYKDASVAFAVFDCTDPTTLEPLAEMMQVFEEKAAREHTIFLVGNKIDKPKVVTNQEAQEFAQKHNISDIFYTSALTGEGIPQLQETLEKYIDNYEAVLQKSIEISQNRQRNCC